MFIPILHLAACLSLAGASLYWILRRKNSPGFHRFIFPFIMVAGAVCVLPILAILFEIGIAYYSGSMVDFDIVSYRLTGPSWWRFASALAIPLLPLLGIVPAIGRRPHLMAGIGIVSAVPNLFLLGDSIASFFD